MDNYSKVEEVFLSSLTRCRSLCEVQGYLSSNYTPALETTDMLRASVVLSVSAFDYLIHELFRVEVKLRHRQKLPIDRFDVPFNILVSNEEDREVLIENFVNKTNSFRSFVDPGKFSDAIGCLVKSPWDKIAAATNSDVGQLKKRLRAIHRWRNRIAHEADINPILSGVELWPIVKEDVLDAINDIEKIGLATVDLLRAQ